MIILRALTILLLCYFICGTMFLPEGDFATLPDLPKMYADCKEQEDPDMNLQDFMTEHLFEINGLAGLFDQKADEPDEKPHQPVQFHHQFMQLIFASRQLKVELVQPVVIVSHLLPGVKDVTLTGYTASVFRPPVCCFA